MGKWKELAEEERQKRWQQHYEDYMNSVPPQRISITTVDAAEQYANDQMEEEEAQRDGPEPPE
jgi:L-rhamnose mutarotase